METDKTETAAPAEPGAGEGEKPESEVISIPKKDYETMNQTLGSLKRELKDLKKSQEAETPTKQTKTEESALSQQVESLTLQIAGITHQDDIELARATAKKWQMDIGKVLMDDDFKAKLEKQQTSRSNVEATTGIKGSGAPSEVKNSLAYWQAKGTPPTPSDIPDRKARQKIIREMIRKSGSDGIKFYNE